MLARRGSGEYEFDHEYTVYEVASDERTLKKQSFTI